ncbi:unnamed protein product [Rotaria sp. Silwood2]|nr:unnamed protein product [Rotaria sp. Silwood2]CAF3065022.1 unnamed protein product [Rotaria sp. Silwood2]CAF3369556.1 unnamed protein product [Rotaria sp. Silwood2]CAF3423202.1 unnamed protein product [Rotaria sp. Silwood2]CAF4387221.1 unnamed protein product [Rotaria sp. Silwood2]
MLISKHGMVKLSDFGTCYKINEINSVQSGAMGTIAYFSPELVRTPSKPSTIQADMWALGISLVEIVNGKHPCLASDGTDQFHEILAWNPEVLEATISVDMQKLILHLLKEEVEERPCSYADILNMSFIKCLPQRPTNEECNFVNDVIQIIHKPGA